MNTYAKCIKELGQWGYIEYVPSANMYSGSMISCIRFDTARKIVSDTAGDISSDTPSDTASDTLLINITNSTKGKTKKTSPKENGKTSKNRLHASTDKDYSEPL